MGVKLSGNTASAAGDHRNDDDDTFELGTTQNTDEEMTLRNPDRESTPRNTDHETTPHSVNA